MTYPVAAGEVGVHSVALSAGSEVVVTFAYAAAVEVSSVSSASDFVYFTVDGTPATVKGAKTMFLFPGVNAAEVPIPSTARAGVRVRLISASPSTVSVTRVTR